MSKAFGYNYGYLMKRETTPGTAATGNFVKIPILTSDLGKSQGNLPSAVLGLGRDPQDFVRDNYDVGGNTVVPVDCRYIGYWLTGLLGDPSTTADEDVYTHVFESGGTSLPAFSHEVGHKGPAAFEMNTGVYVNSMQFSKASGAGLAQASVALIGMGNAKNGTTQGGTPVTQTMNYAGNATGVVKLNGSVVANITNFDFTYSNNLVADRDTTSDGGVTQIDPGEASISGRISSRFVDTTLYDIARAATRFDMELLYPVDADLSLSLAINGAVADISKASVSGPGGYSMEFNFNGEYDSGAGSMFTATLVNDLAGTTYTS